ncbi:MAG TPA: hypothetical protein VLF79_03005 [Candidatus Saccharimonadales bacterium]|nr:hypothetical protein [Candidatus Saccharimonadales bacterium]
MAAIAENMGREVLDEACARYVHLMIHPVTHRGTMSLRADYIDEVSASLEDIVEISDSIAQFTRPVEISESPETAWVSEARRGLKPYGFHNQSLFVSRSAEYLRLDLFKQMKARQAAMRILDQEASVN